MEWVGVWLGRCEVNGVGRSDMRAADDVMMC